MADWTSTQSGDWSRASDNADSPWYDGGTQTARATYPTNNEGPVTIAAGHVVTMDVDMSGYADGIAGITINSSSGTPGRLKFKSSADGTYYLKVKSNTNIAGSGSATNLGQLIMGHIAAISTHTDVAANDAINEASTTRANGDKIAFLAGSGTLPAPLVGNKLYYVVEKSANAFKLSLTPGGSAIDLTTDGSGTYEYVSSPGTGRKQVIELNGTGEITGRYLTQLEFSNEPTNPYCTIVGYGTTQDKVAVTVSDDSGTALFTVSGTAPANGTVVKLTGTALPGGFSADTQYYVVSSTGAGHTFKLALYTGLAALPYSSAGASVYFYIGLPANHGAGSGDELVVLEDVTSDPLWSTTAPFHKLLVADEGPADVDYQITTLAAVTSSTKIELAADVDSAQYPGAKVWLASRNVMILANGTDASDEIINQANNTATAVNPVVIACGVVAYAATTANRYKYGVYSGTSHTISGSIAGCTYGVYSGASHTISGSIAGCTNGVYGGASHTISGSIAGCTNGINGGASHTISGSIAGCTYGVYGGASHTISGSIAGCTNGVYSGTCLLRNCTFSGNAYDIRRPRGIVGYGVTLNGGTQLHEYLESAELLRSQYCGTTIYDFADNIGYIGRWDVGGKTISAVYASGTHGTPPVTRTGRFVHETTCQDVDAEHWVDVPIYVCKGQTPTVRVYAKGNSTGFTAAAVFELLDPSLAPGSDVLDTETLANDTDWHAYTLATTPATEEKQLLLRMRVRDASKTLYWFQTYDPRYPNPDDVRYGVSTGIATGLLEIPNSGTPTGTQDETSDACVVSGKKYGYPVRTGTASGGGGYTYGDEDPAYVLTTAEGAGSYVEVSAADVQEGVEFGPLSAMSGTFVVPAEADVRKGVEYGSGAEFVGTLRERATRLIEPLLGS